MVALEPLIEHPRLESRFEAGDYRVDERLAGDRRQEVLEAAAGSHPDRLSRHVTELSGHVDGTGQVTELVDEATLEGAAASEDLARCDGARRFKADVTALGNGRDERFEEVVDQLLF